MIDPTWHVASLVHLKLMLKYAQGSLEHDASRNIIRGFPQQLELTLPWVGYATVWLASPLAKIVLVCLAIVALRRSVASVRRKTKRSVLADEPG